MLAIAGAGLLALGGVAAAQKSWMPEGFVEVAYGSDPRQTLAYARPVVNRTVPLVVFIHGGGWARGDKARNSAPRAAWLGKQGWAYATVNYRLVPDATVEQQAADIASAVAWLRGQARARGFDPDRIVLMGHSAGAHLAALVGTDERYLKAAGVPLSAVRGAVLLDGAGYDVARQMAEPNNRVQRMYQAAFSTDPARQRALSPTQYVQSPNVAKWLILPVARRADSVGQSSQLAEALRKGGAEARVVPVQGEGHRSLNVGLGEDGDFATGQVEAFLKALR